MPRLTQIEDVKSCNGYYSASDLRIHFGLGEAKRVEVVEIRWPSGAVDTLKDLDVNRFYVVEEGGKDSEERSAGGGKEEGLSSSAWCASPIHARREHHAR